MERRSDGRLSNQLRPILCEPHVLARADGSIRYSNGNTTVIVAVYGHREAKVKNEQLDRSTIQIEFHHTLNQYETGRLRNFENLLRTSLEEIVITSMHPRSLILVVVQVLRDDGSLLSVSLNAAVLALIDAGIPIKGMLGAITCGGMIDGSIFLDTTREEEEKCPRSQMTFIYSFDRSLITSYYIGSLKIDKLKSAIELARDSIDTIFSLAGNSLQKQLNHFNQN